MNLISETTDINSIKDETNLLILVLSITETIVVLIVIFAFRDIKLPKPVTLITEIKIDLRYSHENLVTEGAEEQPSKITTKFSSKGVSP